MKNILKFIILTLTLMVSFFYAHSQSIDIPQNRLPYEIPVIDNGTEYSGFEYRWLENGKIVSEKPNSYIISVGKPIGQYTYNYQVKCGGCTDWLSSNDFTVTIVAKSMLKSGKLNPDDLENISVTFSPQTDMFGYIDELISVIDSTHHTLEISLYSLESLDVFEALERASDRGVKIRMLYEGALEERKELSGTVSHILEETGIDVKYVNKTNHHKFIISDNNYLVTSSGNWNDEANSLYDENTIWITHSELLLRYRGEFEYLWNNSREFGQQFSFSNTNISPDSLINLIVDNPNVDAVFTSSNYRTYISSVYGPTFAKVLGNQNAADKIVDLINQAEYSIHIAANHLRSRPISEALIAKKQQNPQIEIKVYLDGQEYVSEEYNDYQLAKREECLAEATTDRQIRDCMEKNFYYSYELIKAGIDVRFKTYSYKWHHNTAALMHNKYAIFDNQTIATGSYNYSFNAETNSMENVVIFNNQASPTTVSDYVNSFTTIWETGVQENYYNDILLHLNFDSRFVPLLYIPMSLNYSQIRTLRATTENVCPTIMDEYFKDNRELYDIYIKNIDLTYDSQNRISVAHDKTDNQLKSQFEYNEFNKIISIKLFSSDSIIEEHSYEYDSISKLTHLNTPQYDLNFSYDAEMISKVNTGQITHTWQIDSTQSGGYINRYSTSEVPNYITIEWNSEGFPIEMINADSSKVTWEYSENKDLLAIKSDDRNVLINNNTSGQEFSSTTNDGESIVLNQTGRGIIQANSTGTLDVVVQYTIDAQDDKKQKLEIEITSNQVSTNRGKNATINYSLDCYGRIIQSDNLLIEREAYSGNITSITDGDITETRNYNEWELLVAQSVKHEGQIYYQATYQYDELHRITKAVEIVFEDTTTLEYTYNYAGQLEQVKTNSFVSEEYTYDNFENRLTANLNGIEYTYSYSGNQLTEYTWNISGSNKKKTFRYNARGQLEETENKSQYGSYYQTTSSKNFDYNIFGNQNSVSWASKTQEFIYDPYDRQIANVQNGDVERKLVYGTSSVPIAELNGNERIISTFIYADGYTPVVMRKGSIDYYIVSDIRGSVRMVIKENTGSVRQQISYDSFGNIIDDTNPGYTPFGFAGGLYEPRTELLRFGARDYSPEIGRWTAEDPIGFWSGDINFYAYVKNDPVNTIDPSGYSGGEFITLYRGVNSSAGRAYERGRNGIVKPRGGLFGHSNAIRHNRSQNGTIKSRFTSWTTNKDVAKNFALRPTGKGVVLTIRTEASKTIASPNTKSVLLVHKSPTVVSEDEVLIKGTIKGASVSPISH